MKIRTILIAAHSTLLASVAHASEVTLIPEPSSIGAPYSYLVTLGANDFGEFLAHVGGWSWEDNSLFVEGGTPVGWTHTSQWVYLTLTETTTLTLTMERNANVPWPSLANPDQMASTDRMFPSFTLWSGVDTTSEHTTEDRSHEYSNRGVPIWAAGFSLISFADNSTEAQVQRTWQLGAGNYTIAMGSNAPSTNSGAERQGFRATFTTAVPEPVTAFLIACGMSLLGMKRRRQSLV